MDDHRTGRTRTTTARTAALAAAALGLLLTTTACGDDSPTTGGDTAVPVAQVGTATPAAPPPPPTSPTPPAPAPAPAPAEAPALADGTYEVHVLSADGDSVGLDLGRFVVGEPVEPGVDSTAPITFDTGAAEEDADLPLADDARLTLHVAGRGASRVSPAELAAAVEASTSALLATVEVVDGAVTSLEELYRA